MTCENWQDLLLDREHLNDAQRQKLDEHLSDCADCKIWAMALAEVDARAVDLFQTEVNPVAFQERVLRAVARQLWRNWMSSVPDFLDVLGWSAIGLLGMVGLLVWTDRVSLLGNHLVWMGAPALVGGVAWAAVVLWKEESGTRVLL
jgi:predicted anti-sigma-YlaC factor YlaD